MSPSPRWSALLGVGALVALVQFTGCATTDEEKAARDSARMQSLRTELIARGDVDSLAASALFERLRSGKFSNQAPELAARAIAAAPDRADLVLEAIELCQQVSTCNPEPLETRLQQLDPDNGIPWTYALMQAAASGDADALRRARVRLAASRRVTWYWNQTIHHMTAAVAGRAGFDQSTALVAVIGVEAALPAALGPISKVCSEPDLRQPEVLTQCRQIAAAFCRADTELFEAFGTALGLRVWPEGSAERARYAAERRVLHYRMDLMGRYTGQVNSVASMRVLTTLYTQYPTEQEAFRALFVRLGLNPEPPMSWQDPSP